VKTILQSNDSMRPGGELESAAVGEKTPNHNPNVANAVGPRLPRLAYSMRETAVILGVSYITVHRLVQRGLLKSSTALRHKLIPLFEIERFLKATTK
jgi:hypothetical protein